MTQQNWPFENRICGVTSGQEMNDTDDDGEADDEQDVANENIVYIVEGGQICYGSNEHGTHAEIADCNTAMRLGKDSEKPSESFPLRLDAV